MADNFSFCLLGAMDRLWFNQIILFSEPFPLLFTKTLKPVQLLNSSESSTNTNTSTTPSSTQSFSSLPEDSATSSPLPSQSPDVEEEEEEVKRRPTRVSISCSRSSRSHSSSPSSTDQKRDRKKKHRQSVSCSPGSGSGSGSRLTKSMSCRSLKDLELEEVKGFMDLGFIFKKEHLNQRMISVVPGLLRLGLFKTKHKTTHEHINNIVAAENHDEVQLAKADVDDDIEQVEEEIRGVMRPYLSEAWLIKRPDSPLLNLRVPRGVYAAADMKKHLKFWARTVASEVQQAC